MQYIVLYVQLVYLISSLLDIISATTFSLSLDYVYKIVPNLFASRLRVKGRGTERRRSRLGQLPEYLTGCSLVTTASQDRERPSIHLPWPHQPLLRRSPVLSSSPCPPTGFFLWERPPNDSPKHSDQSNHSCPSGNLVPIHCITLYPGFSILS